MTILVAGDSWGCGEWPRGDTPNRQPSHGGLAQYLSECGLEVLNLSRGGSSNSGIAQSLRNYLSRQSDPQIEKIFVFQTEYTRDQHFIFEEDWASVTEADTVSGIWISRFYYSLSDIAAEYKCKIYLIGGCSDTLWFENIDRQYPGLNIACQSMTNLILTRNPMVEHNPVLDWYNQSSVELVKKIKKQLPQDKIQQLIKLVDLGLERENIIYNTPKYFWPDGVHPNRVGHKILFNYLKEQGYLD